MTIISLIEQINQLTTPILKHLNGTPPKNAAQLLEPLLLPIISELPPVMESKLDDIAKLIAQNIKVKKTHCLPSKTVLRIDDEVALKQILTTTIDNHIIDETYDDFVEELIDALAQLTLLKHNNTHQLPNGYKGALINTLRNGPIDKQRLKSLHLSCVDYTSYTMNSQKLLETMLTQQTNEHSAATLMLSLVGYDFDKTVHQYYPEILALFDYICTHFNTTSLTSTRAYTTLLDALFEASTLENGSTIQAQKITEGLHSFFDFHMSKALKRARSSIANQSVFTGNLKQAAPDKYAYLIQEMTDATLLDYNQSPLDYVFDFFNELARQSLAEVITGNAGAIDHLIAVIDTAQSFCDIIETINEQQLDAIIRGLMALEKNSQSFTDQAPVIYHLKESGLQALADTLSTIGAKHTSSIPSAQPFKQARPIEHNGQLDVEQAHSVTMLPETGECVSYDEALLLHATVGRNGMSPMI